MMGDRLALTATLALSTMTGGAAPAATTQPSHIIGAVALTRVFGDGQRLVGVAVEYDQPIAASSLQTADYRVLGRTVTWVRAAARVEDAGIADENVDAPSGRFVIVSLDPNEAGASLRIDAAGGGGGPPATTEAKMPHSAPRAAGGPRFGPRDIVRPASAAVTQVGQVTTVSGGNYGPVPMAVTTTRVVTPIVDEFHQMSFTDPATGVTIKYNLFVPRNYRPGIAYPLVLFMHDAGVLSHDTTATLKQGLGALSFASPQAQARHPAFVVAPQYTQVTVNDQSDADAQMDATVALVRAISRQYGIDTDRLYATGQSMGAMTALAMGIKYPDLFAASYIVAGQWDAAKVAPLVKAKLWILVSQGDERAYPGENAITAALEAKGATVARAVWDGTADPAQQRRNVTALVRKGAQINYVALRRGTVVPTGQPDNAGANHTNTWRLAYSIPGIRDWLFRQHR